MPLNPLFQHSNIPTFQGILLPVKPFNFDLAHRRSRYAGKDQVFFAQINVCVRLRGPAVNLIY